MDINLYTTPNPPNKIGKTKENLKNFTDVIFYDDSELNLINPVIVINGFSTVEDFAIYNYCYIPKMKRFYFIENIRALRGKRIEIQCKVDVLESFKTDIRASKQLVARQENAKSQYLVDNRLPISKKTDILVNNFGASFTENNSFVLTTVGTKVVENTGSEVAS